jgi:hypothetical protein
MAQRPRTSPITRLALLCAASLLLLAALPVRGATSVEVEARALVGGRYAAGGWLAVSVALANDGAPTEGYVAAESTSGVVRRFVELPAGARKQVTLYVRPEGFQRNLPITFESPEGTASTTVEVRVLERSSGQVAIVGDGGGNLRPQLLGDDQGAPEPLTLGPADLPERPEPLAGLDAIVWAGDSSALAEPQRRAMERWVAAGGQLVVIGGPDWQARTAAFVDLLPVDGLAAAEGGSLAGLAAWAGVSDPPADEPTLATGTLRDGAIPLVVDGETPILSMISRGGGRVVFVAADLATEPWRGWTGGPGLWARLLPNDELAEQFFGGFPVEEEAANAMSQALSNLPSLEVPSAELLLAVIVGYILLIGPVSYLVLRRLDRRELAWITAPILVLLFTACSYGIGTAMKGSAIILNQVTLVRTASEASAASVQTYAGLFSPTRDSYDLTVEGDALIGSVQTQFIDPNSSGVQSYVTEQGDPAHLRGLSMGVFGFHTVRADAVVAYQPDLQVSWRFADGAVGGTVTNAGDEAIEDVAIVGSSGGRMIGDLEPGASKDFELSSNNFNGSAASEQVYGFGGFDASSPEQRRSLLRRQVIDALVGYGGWWPGRGMGLGGSTDRGPYIIGWHGSEGPLPVEVDDEVIQRYAQTVEVIAGRPTLGPGEVRLDPSQLSVRVLSSEGDVSTGEPGFITMGAGEVVFGIALPLEAADLAPTSVRIVAGSDPGMVFSDPGGFGGFLPPGYVMSVRDVTTGAWIELGDLSQQSTFEIDDPASVLNQAGRIEVRVVADAVDQNFGQTGIFVSATVEGVVAP